MLIKSKFMLLNGNTQEITLTNSIFVIILINLMRYIFENLITKQCNIKITGESKNENKNMY